MKKIRTALVVICMMAVGLTAHARFSSINGTDLTIQNIYFASDYLTSGGVTDNYAAFQALLDTFTGGETLIFDKNDYYFSDDSYCIADNVTLIGNSTGIIAPKGWFANTPGSTYYTSQGISFTAGERTFAIPGGLSVVAGQYIHAYQPYAPVYCESSSGDYYKGVMARVLAVVGNTGYLSHAPHQSFTGENVRIRDYGDNIKISGFDIDMSGATAGYTAIEVGGLNPEVSGCVITGNDNAGAGIKAYWAIGADIHDNIIDHFFDITGTRIGYGVAMSGHDNVAQRNTISNCKHLIAGADRWFYSTNLRAVSNWLWNDVDYQDSVIVALGNDPYCSAPLDMHSNVDHVTWQDNYIWTYGATGETKRGVFLIRNGDASLIGNHVYYTMGASGDCLILNYELPLRHLVLDGNEVTEYTTDPMLLIDTNTGGGYTNSDIVFKNNEFPSTLTHLGCTVKDGRLYSATVPSSYAWEVGDIVYNSAPGANIGWINTAAGSPGTWKTLYAPDQDTSTTSAVSFTSSSIPLTLFRTVSGASSAWQATGVFESVASGAMSDGFGPLLYFKAEDDDLVHNTAGQMWFSRNGADNTYDFNISPYYYGGAGTSFPILKLLSKGQLILNYNNTASNGVLTVRPPISDLIYHYNGDTAAYTNRASEGYTSGGTAFTMLAYPNASHADKTDYLYIAGTTSQPFNGIYIDIATAGAGVALKVEYASGVDGSSNVNAWTELTDTDGTTNLTLDGTNTWTMPTDWVAGKVNGYSRYWLRLSSTTEITTPPTAYQINPSQYRPMEVYAAGGDTTAAMYVRRDGSTALKKQVVGITGSTTLTVDQITNAHICVTIGATSTDNNLPDISPSTGSLIGTQFTIVAHETAIFDAADTNDTIYLDGASIGAGDAIDMGDESVALCTVTGNGILEVQTLAGTISDGGAD